jgi:predicted GNAT family N-acyltransferase
MSAVRIKRVSSAKDLARAFTVRLRVFVCEQGVPADIEIDADDRRAVHFLALVSGRAVGTARLVFGPTRAKIGRMAVLRNYRGRGIGRKLLRAALAGARKSGVENIYLHAQLSAIPFYERLGFRTTGPVFSEAGIPHRKMSFREPSAGRGARQRSLSGG